MTGLFASIGFTAPAILAGLLALPLLYWLLRVTPPRPQRVPFPPLRILRDLIPEKQTPARTPLWLLLLRMAIVALAILAAAGPFFDPLGHMASGARGPVLLFVENGALAAHDWRDRQEAAQDVIEAAQRDGRGVALITTAERVVEVPLLTPGAALERLRAVRPQPHVPDRAAIAPAVDAFLKAHAGSEVVMVTDGVARATDTPFAPALGAVLSGRPLIVHRATSAGALALTSTQNLPEGLDVRLVRAEPNGRESAILIASDSRGLPLGRVVAAFGTGARETTARFEMPLELRNAVSRIDIEGERSAAGVALVDGRSQRRRVGIVGGQTADTSQPLLAPTFYVSRALAPFSEIREVRGNAADAVQRLIDERASVIVLADIGALDAATTQRLERFMSEGGVLIRFAGSRLAAATDTLTPVRLRRGGRSIGGSLSWEAPKALAPFPAESPFAGIQSPREVTVTRQILAEPDSELNRRTWAALADGTPVVTGEARGRGQLVLFHVTADPGWSSLPLSGTFIDMLRVLVGLSGQGESAVAEAGGALPAAPRVILDGFGVAGAPPGTAKPVARDFAGPASADHPAGLYGPVEGSIAVNVMRPQEELVALDLSALNPTTIPLGPGTTLDLRGPLIGLALALLALDTLAMILLGGGLAALARRKAPAAAAMVLGLALALVAGPDMARAQAPSAPPASAAPTASRAMIEAASRTRLAYVLTGDAQVDSVSRAGLQGLSRALGARTAFEPGEPMGVDPARDELSVFPLLYWPVVAGRAVPSEAALRRIDAFMKGGGTVIFDTRDAASIRIGTDPTPATQQLRRMLATLDIPELEELPKDHVITKAFYLLDELPGRYATGRTWLEALPPVPDGEARPARSGDGISPIIITGNDLAAAWAVSDRGEPLFAMVGGGERQREMALRGGINLVMYALTGNYKADQVHVGPLLERLGQ